MTRPGIEPRSPEPLVNTLNIMPMSGNLTVKELFHEKWVWRIEQESEKKSFLLLLATVIKKGLSTSIRKPSNEMKVHEKTVWTAS